MGPTLVGGSLFCLVGQKTLAGSQPQGTGSGHPSIKALKLPKSLILVLIRTLLVGGECLTQSGQNNVCRLPLTHWPKDLWQEGVATHRDHAGLGQVGARVVLQIEELLQLLHSLQRKAPFSNLQATQRRPKGLQSPTEPPATCRPSSPPLTLTCTAAEPPHTDSASRSRTPAALILSSQDASQVPGGSCVPARFLLCLF